MNAGKHLSLCLMSWTASFILRLTLPRHLITRSAQDSLLRRTTRSNNHGRLGGGVFCNPPYGRKISDFVKKAYTEFQNGVSPIVLLIPSRTDTRYFHNYIYGKAEIRFLQGRLYFTNPNGSNEGRAPFPSMIVIYRNGAR